MSSSENSSPFNAIILAPKGVEKTTNLGTTSIAISLDYAFMTRNYLNYSDFDDPRVQNFYFTVYNLNGYEAISPLDDQIKYMQNTIMYLEDSIAYETASINFF